MYVLVYMYICSFYVFFLEKKVAYTLSLYNFNEKGLGNCVDPDPNLEYGFGSIMSLTMDPIWIWIHHYVPVHKCIREEEPFLSIYISEST